MAEPAVVVLAGGQARRMGGGDKALRLLGGLTLLAHVLGRVDPSGALRAGGRVALSANGDPARFGGFGLPVLADAVGAGPLAGILAGMVWAAEQGCSTLLSVPADCPFLPTDLAERLAGAPGPVACAASHGQVHHATALWSVGLRAELAAALEQGVQRVRAFVAGRGASVGFEDGDIDPFLNLNTPLELAAAEASLAGSHSQRGSGGSGCGAEAG